MAKADNLTDKQRAFVGFYLGDAHKNATRAAVMAGYSPKTASEQAYELLRKPQIRAAIDAELEAIRAEGVRSKRSRLEDYEDLRRRIKIVLDARAKEYGGDGEPDEVAGRFILGSGKVVGGESGLVVKKLNVVGSGRGAKVIEEHTYDPSPLNQLLAVNKQTAQEMGEWSEKRQISGPNEGPIEIANAESATEKLLAWLAQDEAGESEGEVPQSPQG